MSSKSRKSALGVPPRSDKKQNIKKRGGPFNSGVALGAILEKNGAQDGAQNQ